jgi:MinD superfamily P-loop ATPase
MVTYATATKSGKKEMERCGMSKVIAVANTAGGSGKTTVAHAVAAASVEYGKKTLLIDLDPKADLTFRLGREGGRNTAADFLSGTQLTTNIVDTTAERFDFIGADSRLVSPFESGALSKFITAVGSNYAVIVLDLASSITPPLAQAIEVADLFLLPVRDNLHDLRGALQIASLTGSIKTVALQVGSSEPVSSDFEFIDCSIEVSDEVETAQLGNVSVLTSSKTSRVAENFREATYSILEKLALL